MTSLDLCDNDVVDIHHNLSRSSCASPRVVSTSTLEVKWTAGDTSTCAQK